MSVYRSASRQMMRDRLRDSMVSAGHFLRLFLPLAIALSVVAVGLYHKDRARSMENLQTMERNRIEVERTAVQRTLQNVVSDLLFLRDLYPFSEKHNARRPTPDIDRIRNAFIRFADVRGKYDQIRLLDRSGRELVRVDMDGGVASAAEESELQDKSSRYYYLRAVSLGPDDIFVTPFDLNVEHGQIELPHNPVLRLVASVRSFVGEQVGYLVLNYSGQALFKELKRLHVNSPGHISLLNSDGYWMLGPSPELEWGFMFEDGKAKTLERTLPEVWKLLHAGTSGQMLVDDGLYTFQTLKPLGEVEAEARRIQRKSRLRVTGLGSNDYEWKLVAHVPRHKLNAIVLSTKRTYLWTYGVLMAFAVLGAWIVSRATRYKAKANAELAHINRDLNTVVQRLERRNRASVRMNSLVDFLQACRTEDEIYDLVAGNLEQLLPGTSGMLSIHDEETGLLACAASWGGQTGCSRTLFAQDACWALRRGQSHVVSKPGSGPICSHFNPEPDTGFICVPLIAHGKVTGLLSTRFPMDTLAMESDRLQRYVANAEQNLVGVAEHVALTLSNLRLRESLREQSIRDQLTGLYNRRHMEESLSREFSRASRHSQPLSVIILDVDHFKNFNDTYGHEMGDEVLRKLGETLRTFSRVEDIACRFGGEEFLLILPGASAENAARRAEELRDTIENRMPVRHGDKKLRVTVSLGVSEFPEHAQSVETLITTADAALYDAKESGRNRVSVARPLAVVAHADGKES